MKRILVTGAAGMLGSKVSDHLFNTNYEVFGTGRKKIESAYTYINADLLKAEERNELLNIVKPDVIVHCAANVNLNDCEQNPENAYAIHVEASEKLAQFNSGKTKIIYVSTDSVFNGKGNYSEQDTPAPLNVYAETKYQGEHAVANANPNHTILRTNIYGFNSIKSGNSLFEWIYQNLSTGNTITGFTDVTFNPLYIGQLSDVILNCIEKNITGTYHTGCDEMISKYQFAKKIAETFSFEKSLIKASSADNVAANVKRPANTTLNHSALDKALEKKYNLHDGIEQLKLDFFQHKKSHEQY